MVTLRGCFVVSPIKARVALVIGLLFDVKPLWSRFRKARERARVAR